MLRLTIPAAILLLHLPIAVFAQQVNLLVVAIHGVETAEKEWQPTIDFLSQALPQHDFSLAPVIPSELPKMRALIRDGKIDFVISQPAIYVDLELNFGVSRILTMVKQGGYSEFGSVIIVRADSDIHVLDDLRGKTVAGVARLGFGGWLVGYKEMLDNGFDPYADARQVVFLGTQPKEVQALLAREADAAVIRTGTLEKLSAQGKVNMADFRILVPKSYPGFALQVSTPLYPEWALAKTNKASNALTKELALALLSLTSNHPVARQARFQEWTFPYDYQPVHNLLKSLRVGPYRDYGTVTLTDVVAEHWIGMLTVITLTLTIFLVIVIWNRKLEKEIAIRKVIERSLRENEKKLLLAASVFSHAGEGIAITDPQANILDVNEAFTRITGYGRDEVLGQNPRLLKSGRHDDEFYRTLWSELTGQGQWVGQIWNRRKNHEIYAEKLSINAVKNDDGQIQRYVAIFSDITRQLMHEQEMEHLAHYDALTDLPNRVLLGDRLRQAMVQVKRRGKQLAVVFLDLDGFKEINDRHGHNAGDQLLVTIAGRLREALRQGDTVARLGGDEFAAVLIDLGSDTDCIPLLERVLGTASQPVHSGNLMLQVSASVGVTFYPQADSIDADQLLRQADQAMYQAKLAGKNGYKLFDAQRNRVVTVHQEGAERIHQALTKGEFVLHYQPRVNMKTGKVPGVEALVRWQHPDKGLLPPDKFLRGIENDPLRIDIDTWAIGEAATQLVQWHRQGLALSVSTNISTFNIQRPDFVERLKKQLTACRELDNGFLELEVPETGALEDIAHVSEVINACLDIGIRFTLADFGTGYSTLTYLKQLRASVLKIDRSFVNGMLNDPEDLAILEGIIGLATAFRRQVIAEGVETAEHGKLLLQLGCELGQGPGIAKPMPAEALPEWIAGWKPYPQWLMLRPVSRDDHALLLAASEHSAWVRDLAAFLTGEGNDVPPLSPSDCLFSRWLDGRGRRRYSDLPIFKTILDIHEQVHRVGVELHDLYCEGHGRQSVDGLHALYEASNVLLEQMDLLLREGK